MANGATITSVGLAAFLDRFYNLGNYTAPTQIRVGTGTTTPAASDTALATDLGSVGYIAYSSSYVDAGNARSIVTATLGASQGNGGSISEIGEFNASGQMMSRDVFTATAKTASKRITYTITHQAAQG